MSEQPKQARELIALAHDADDPSPDDRERIHVAFSARLAALGIAAPPAPNAAPRPAARPHTTASTSATPPGAVQAGTPLFAKLALIVGAGALVAAGLWFGPKAPRDSAEASRPAAALQHKPAAIPSASAPASSVSPALVPTAPSAPVAAAVLESQPTPAHPRLRRPIASVPGRAAAELETPAPVLSVSPQPSATAPTDRLSAELALIERARSALRAARPTEALSVLRTHQSEFPQGVLSEERSGLRALALCALPDREAGLRERAAFLQNAPTSVLASRVRAACVARGADDPARGQPNADSARPGDGL